MFEHGKSASVIRWMKVSGKWCENSVKDEDEMIIDDAVGGKISGKLNQLSRYGDEKSFASPAHFSSSHFHFFPTLHCDQCSLQALRKTHTRENKRKKDEVSKNKRNFQISFPIPFCLLPDIAVFFAHFILPLFPTSHSHTAAPHPWTSTKCFANNFVLNSTFSHILVWRLLRKRNTYEIRLVFSAHVSSTFVLWVSQSCGGRKRISVNSANTRNTTLIALKRSAAKNEKEFQNGSFVLFHKM